MSDESAKIAQIAKFSGQVKYYTSDQDCSITIKIVVRLTLYL